MDIIITTQGGDYTSKMFKPLRDAGWKGYWIDAASTLRMEEDTKIILDPVSHDVLDKALNDGILSTSVVTALSTLLVFGGWFN